MDERAVQLPPADLSILAGVNDEQQRGLLKSTMESHAYRVAEVVGRVSELENETKSLRAIANEGERAIGECKGLRSKLASAEHALNAASRVADKERSKRQAPREHDSRVAGEASLGGRSRADQGRGDPSLR